MTLENSSDVSTRKSLGRNDIEAHSKSMSVKRGKSRSRWLLAYFVLAMMHGVVGAYFGIVHNSQGESCRYVEEGAPYHLIIEGEPCVLTSVILIDIGLAFLLWAPIFLIIFAAVSVWKKFRRNLKPG